MNQKRALRIALILLAAATFVFSPVNRILAFQQNYGIDSQAGLNMRKTTAMVDTFNHEIRLPRYGPSTVSFCGENTLDYTVVTPDGVKHYGFDGTQMRENAVLSVSEVIGPVAAAAATPYSNTVIATSVGLKHYVFTGTEMIENPLLAVTGLTGVMSIGTRNLDVAVVGDNKLQYYGWDGANLRNVPNLSVQTGLDSPISTALFSDSYDCVVLEPDQVKYFSSAGGLLEETPALVKLLTKNKNFSHHK